MEKITVLEFVKIKITTEKMQNIKIREQNKTK